MEWKSRRVLRFESLEERVYLSVSGHSIAAARTAHVSKHPVPLTGSIHISLPVSASSPAPTQGTGNVHPIGAVAVAGTLSSTAISGSGELTLSGRKGSVSLVFDVPPRSRVELPKFRFTITGGTGAYANATGHGTMSFIFQVRPTLGLKFNGTFRAG